MNDKAIMTLLCIIDKLDERLEAMEGFMSGFAFAAGNHDAIKGIKESAEEYSEYRSQLEDDLNS